MRYSECGLGGGHRPHQLEGSHRRIRWPADYRLDEGQVGELCRRVIHRGRHVCHVGGGDCGPGPANGAECGCFGNRKPNKNIVERALNPMTSERLATTGRVGISRSTALSFSQSRGSCYALSAGEKRFM